VALRERRAQPRATYGGWVELVLAGARRLARSHDLSARGLGLSLDPPHPRVGEELEGEFPLPGISVPLYVRARVAWSDPPRGRLGLSFGPLDAPVAELLSSYVAGRFPSA
jgi:hypothetical protein